MKRLLLILLLSGCSPNELPLSDKCGIVISKGISELTSQTCYWIEVENQITKEIKKICLNQNDFHIFNVGNTFCKK